MAAGEETGYLTARWQKLGSESHVSLEAADLWTVELPFVQPIVTAIGEHRSRPLVLVRLVGTSGEDHVEGWGECAALADTTYDREDVHHAFSCLEEALLPGLRELADGSGGALPQLADLTGLRASAPNSHMAFAAVEMAVADAHLKTEGRSLAGLLGVEGEAVELGAVVGTAPSEGELVDRVAVLVEQGYSRIKLKIGPGWDVAPLEAVSEMLYRRDSRGHPGPAGRSQSEWVSRVRLQADANGSYTERDEDHLVELDRFGLLCLEQPYGPHEPTRSDDPHGSHDLATHARLAARLRTPICLDESVRSPADIDRALAAQACAVVCLKPARLGGLGQALAVLERCVAGGIPLWMGGMFESGYARGVNTAIAALPGFTWPGDLSPARSYLGADLVQPPELIRASRPRGANGARSASLASRPPAGPGMGEPPRLDAVVRLAVKHVRIDLP